MSLKCKGSGSSNLFPWSLTPQMGHFQFCNKHEIVDYFQPKIEKNRSHFLIGNWQINTLSSTLNRHQLLPRLEHPPQFQRETLRAKKRQCIQPKPKAKKEKKEPGWRFVEILIFVSDISCERTGKKKNFMMPAIKHTRLGTRFIYSTIRDLPRRVFSPPLLTFQA